MKRLSLTLAALSMAAVAGPLKVGADLSLGMVSPTVGKNFKNTTAEGGLGLAIGVVADYSFAEKIGASCGLAFARQSWSLKHSSSYAGESFSSSSNGTTDVTQNNLELSLGPVFRPMEKLSFGAGYRWSMPLGGSMELNSTNTVKFGAESKTTSYSDKEDIKWAGSTPDTAKVDVMSTHNLYVKAGYEVIPHLTVGLDVGIGLTGLIPQYNDDYTKYDGDAPRASNYITNRYALNVRYDFL